MIDEETKKKRLHDAAVLEDRIRWNTPKSSDVDDDGEPIDQFKWSTSHPQDDEDEFEF